MNPNNPNIPPEFLQYATKYPDGEAIGWQFWDTISYPTAGTLALSFFTAMQATLDLTNMPTAGQLPGDQAFLIRGIGFYIKARPESVNMVATGNIQTGGINNVAQIINTGVLTLRVGAKDYLQVPLWMIPSPGGVFGFINVSNVLIGGATVSAGTNGWPHAKSFYTLTKPLLIDNQLNFRVNLYWPALAPIVRATFVTVIMDGDLFRSVQ